MTDKPQFVGKKVRLGDIVKIEKASMPSGNNVWVLNLDAVEKGTGKVIVKNRMKADSAGTSTVAFTADAVLYSKLRPNLNKVVVADGPGLATSEMLPLIVNPEVLDRRYFAYLLRSNSFVNLAVSSTAGSKMPRMNKKTLLNAVFPIPSLELQHQRIDLLSSIEKARTKAELLIQQLDTLVKSRFVEMFGTPDNNIHSLPIKTMGEISEQLIAGGDKPRKISKNKDLKHPYPVFANGTIADGLQGFSEEARVNKSAVTIAARGTIGFCLVREPGFTPVVRLISLVPKPSINVVYLKYFIDLLNLAGSGSSQAQLTLPAFREQQILVPELKEQLEFSTFVAQVDKSRFVAQQQIEKLQMLYDSLAQEYFGD